MSPESELLLIDKPFGVTSYDVIRFLKREYKEGGYPKIKIGHAGTLDPRATGLLLIGLGKMTKQLTGLIGKSKVYEAEILLGKQTTTDDLEGEIISESDVSSLSNDEIKDKVMTLVGEQDIAVPVFSAIKKKGKALYKYARKGQDVEVPVKTMTVHSVELNNIKRVDSEIYLNVTFDVGSGAYIRSLARELGERLGIPATLSTLRRTSIGDYKVEDARVISTEEIKAIFNKDRDSYPKDS
ncbi:tRNA pseudouridine(55) synthase TruB [Candidatus Parcubacteria bacterium]|nr:tRNA pseudouridine(55) synthase TruB [Candidatus Parcubacteria bacterium]